MHCSCSSALPVPTHLNFHRSYSEACDNLGGSILLSAVSAVNGEAATSKTLEPTPVNEKTDRPVGLTVSFQPRSNSAYYFPGYCTPHAVRRVADGVERFSLVFQLQLQETKRGSRQRKREKKHQEMTHWTNHCCYIQAGCFGKRCPDFEIRSHWRKQNLPEGSEVCPDCLNILKDFKGHKRRKRCKASVWPGSKSTKCGCKPPKLWKKR